MSDKERTSARDPLAGRPMPGRRSGLTLLRTAWSEYEQDYARYFAGAMVYYALVSLVPLLLLVLATLGLMLRLSDVAVGAEQQLLHSVETNFGSELRVTIEQVLQRLEQGSVIASIVSLIGLLLTASVLFRHLRLSFRALWKYAPPLLSGSVRGAVRASFLERLIAFAMVLACGGMLLASLAILATLHWLGTIFGHSVSSVLALLGPGGMAFLTFGLLFMFLPPVRLGWRDVGFAAALSAITWMVGAEILGLYLVFSDNNLGAYGAFGALLLLMLWMHAVGKVLFFGAEICKVVAWPSFRHPSDVRSPTSA